MDASPVALELSVKALEWLQAEPPTAYHEMAIALARIHAECNALLQAFAQDCKIPISLIPYLGTDVDIHGTSPGCFNLEMAQAAVGTKFSELKTSLGRTKKRELAVIGERRKLVVQSIERYITVKAQHDVRVSAAFASAFVAFRSTPDKVSPVVKGIMNGVKVRVPFIFSLCRLIVFLRRAKRIFSSRHGLRTQSLRSSSFACNITSLNLQTR